jgi:hypothetical protein
VSISPGFPEVLALASSLAQRCNCAAGVLLNGAGFSPSSPPGADATFSVFAAVGTFDFNYSEVLDLDAKLAALRYSHSLRRFDGPHQWAPANVLDEALAWFRLISMKEGHEERDVAFIKAQAAEAEKRAKNLELAADPYGSWKEYRQAAATFDGLGEAPAFRERAVAMKKEKAVRDGAKREQQDSEEQSRLSASISAGLAALRQDARNRADTRSDVQRQILELRRRAEHEKSPQKLRVAKRALAGIFVEAMETGQERLDAKDISDARICSSWPPTPTRTPFGRSVKSPQSGRWTVTCKAPSTPSAAQKKRAKTPQPSPPGSRMSPPSPSSARPQNSAPSSRRPPIPNRREYANRGPTLTQIERADKLSVSPSR